MPSDEFECDEIGCATTCNNSEECSWFLYGKGAADNSHKCVFFKDNKYGVASIKNENNPKQIEELLEISRCCLIVILFFVISSIC